MAVTIVLSNQKGGVGKTTSAYVLATSLKEKGYKVLAVDMDPQGNLSFAMGADVESATIYDVLKYSLQGTTQGNGLTGGVPPVRFSM